ncbi:MAG: universal stress protein [Gammaproteobacteria bacterium]
MIRTILYPTDLGLHGAFMLQHVVELAVRYDAKVIALHAVEPLGVFADAVLETYIPQDMIGDLRQYGMPAVMEAIRQQVIEAFEEDFIDLPVEPNRFSDVRVVCGAPADVILEQQKLVNADLIVMGSCGADNVHPGPLGSTASKVLQGALVPVYLVPVVKNRTSVETSFLSLKRPSE